MEQESLKTLAHLMVNQGKTVALTGAGVSTESGIPDFRSRGGLWDKYAPEEYATIDAFLEHPEKVWQMLREMQIMLVRAKPNPGHLALAGLESLGILTGIITQNVDGLHQQAGSKNVVEFHGNGRVLSCLDCSMREDAEGARARWEQEFPPQCSGCGRILKPDVVMFGEPIPVEASRQAMQMAFEARVLLVVGTSAVVAPASYIPIAAKQAGAKVVEVNLERRVLSDVYADHTFIGKAGELLPSLLGEVEKAFNK